MEWFVSIRQYRAGPRNRSVWMVEPYYGCCNIIDQSELGVLGSGLIARKERMTESAVVNERRYVANVNKQSDQVDKRGTTEVTECDIPAVPACLRRGDGEVAKGG